MIAVDTNIYIDALDRTSGNQAAAVSFLASFNGSRSNRLLLWQVACEFLAFLRRQQAKQRITATEVESEVSGLLSNHQLIAPEAGVIPIALGLTSRHSLSHWDSLLIAACIHAGIGTFYSRDMSHQATYDSVTVINPFKNT